MDDLFASPDDQFDLNTTGDVPLATTTLDLNLRPHASKRLRLRFNLPAGMSPGAYFIAAVVDRADRIPEADEQNNVAVSTGPFSVG